MATPRPLKKVPPFFLSNPSLKAEILSSTPFLKNLVGGSPLPLLQKGGEGAHYAIL